MGIKYSATYNNVTRDVTDASGSSFVLKYGGKDSGGSDHIIKQETISAGGGKTLSCAGRLMLGDVKAGSIKTISCGGKKAASDIVVSSQSYTPTVTLTITGSGDSSHVGVEIPAYSGAWYYSGRSFTLAKGSQVRGWITGSKLIWSENRGRFYLNGVDVGNTSSELYGTFQINGNCEFALSKSSDLYKWGDIRIYGDVVKV